ncbi:HI0074 family nucleotidyltransferase substrate-binding subunit [Bacillus sp. FJAT-45037]|uniref:HI0074 family nucleotidyltransferase substrate-binding subunit n=1 Tax=Bacillus sp. FJAT-45037 TaxID=2011007 RepID=UPI000C24C647|nr:HI0074 family nucleotidyltransferase substrate-binding subunit [Bacillus sp. FJAT-45037]
MERRVKISLYNLGNAITRLGEALDQDETNSLFIDGTIRRFEFTIELFWKTLKRMLEVEGIEASTPRQSLKEAYAAGWIHNETAWLQMLRDRNETSHVYNEDKAKQIYDRIKIHYPLLVETHKNLTE